MLPSQYARNLPEVGDLILRRVEEIEQLQGERAAMLAAADRYLTAIAEQEQNLAEAIKPLWAAADIKAAKSIARAEHVARVAA